VVGLREAARLLLLGDVAAQPSRDRFPARVAEVTPGEPLRAAIRTEAWELSSLHRRP
jgi:hypothetical protein